MITGIIANPNLDEKNQKAQRLRDVEDSFNTAIEIIATSDKEQKKLEFKDDPFFAAMKFPDVEIQTPTAEEIQELEDRQREHEELMEGLDQT